MLILSLDSAGSSCGACVWRDGQVLAVNEEHMERGQDQRLMPLIVDLMKQSDVSFKDLDRIAVTRGPGSFTGLRIGLAAARGMGLAAEKPVVGIDRFSLFYSQVQEIRSSVLVVIDSKRRDLFCRFYPAKDKAHDPILMSSDEIAAFLKTHDSIVVAGDKEIAGHSLYPAREEAVVTCARLARDADPNSAEYLARPLYLRAPDVTIKAAPPISPADIACGT